MKFEQLLPILLKKAAEAGIEAAEAYYVSADKFSASSREEKIEEYSVSTTHGLSFRGLYQGKMGYCSTQALEKDAISFLVEGVKESALLNENQQIEEIFQGEENYPQIETFSPELEKVTEEEKLSALIGMEKAAKQENEYIHQVADNVIATISSDTHIANSYGLNIQYQKNIGYGYSAPVARKEEKVSTGFSFGMGKSLEEMNLPFVGKQAACRAVDMLDKKSIPSGKYSTILLNEAMVDLLATFSSNFSADNAQKGLSLLAGKENQSIAAAEITMIDDPLMANGLNSRPFDDEGVACRYKEIVREGILQTLLHNRKTAKKGNTQSTGNGIKAGYSSPVAVQPTNFYIQPQKGSLSDLLEEIQEGLVITELEGLHSGANPISGDFSLSAKGYRVEKGKKSFPVSQITVAGNFYTLLKEVKIVGEDLWFSLNGVGSPSVYVGEMSVAGL
ncbi:MAG: TldD/PmbA family protein [Clostridiales bacterium]|nr:TldD/PmbA family protein [Clostridiales bacterium]